MPPTQGPVSGVCGCVLQGGSRALHERAHRLVVTGTAVPDHSGGGEGGGEDAGKGGDGALFTHPLLLLWME